ncbi:hypothetical protein ACFU53_35595 [Streptomyces sp. NPDC057474]|uniref:hypothetical protein n=1 Tax=Streptomyces sp. NPDC057474 TaxID=3346144 RepID=UPI0036BAACF2
MRSLGSRTGDVRGHRTPPTPAERVGVLYPRSANSPVVGAGRLYTGTSDGIAAVDLGT